MKIIIQSDQEPMLAARAAETALRNHPDAKKGKISLIAFGESPLDHRFCQYAVMWNKSSVTVWRQDQPPITQ